MEDFTEKGEKNNKILKIIILIIVLVVVLVSFLLIYNKINDDNKKDASSSSSSENKEYPIGSYELLNDFFNSNIEYRDIAIYINNLNSLTNLKDDPSSTTGVCFFIDNYNDELYLNNNGKLVYRWESEFNINDPSNSEEKACVERVDSHINNINDIFDGTLSYFALDAHDEGDPSIYLLNNKNEIYEYDLFRDVIVGEDLFSRIYTEEANKKIMQIGFVPSYDTTECTSDNNIIIKYANDDSVYLLIYDSDTKLYSTIDFNQYYEGKTIVSYSNACASTISLISYGVDIEKKMLVGEYDDDYYTINAKPYVDLNTKQEVIVKKYFMGYLGWVVISQDDQLYFFGDDIYNYGKIKDFMIDESFDNGNQIIKSISIELVNGQKFNYTHE